MPLIALAVAAIVFNLWMFPRLGGRKLWRPHEVADGRALGMVLYPLSVLTLLLVFYRRPEVAAAGWGVLAFGDGFASLFGQLWGRRRLPWNPRKSWVGSLAFLVFAWLSVTLLVAWTAPGRYPLGFLVGVGAAVALGAAWLESAPQRLDDNLFVPLLAALVLLCMLETNGSWQALWRPPFVHNLTVGLVVNVALVVAARLLATLNGMGAAVACLLGTMVFAFLSWQGYAVLLTFFVLGSLSTRMGYDRKRKARLAQGRGGRRGAANVLANGSVAAACALWVGTTPHGSLFVAAFACSLAAAAADTAESEIGQVWGRPTLLITTCRQVAPGVDGGISVIGTAAGLLAAALTSVVGSAVGLFPATYVIPLSLLAVTATLLESVVGATLERSRLIGNGGANLFNTLAGALLAAGWVWIVA